MVLKLTVNVTTSSDIRALEINTSAQDFSRTTVDVFNWTVTARGRTQSDHTSLDEQA